MFRNKILQSDWLNYRTWTINAFPYRGSGPFLRPLVTDKTQVLGENGPDTIGRRSFEVSYAKQIVGES